MKNKRILKERGITLIALVVTIVVLLILAGVTINAVFSDSGIIKKAQDAQNKANESVQKDMEQINALENWLNENTGEDNKNVPVAPTTDTAPYYPDETFTKVEGTDLSNGLVIQDSNGNEYVWIEVPKSLYANNDYNTETTTADQKPANSEEYDKIEYCLHKYTDYYRNGTSYTDTYYSNAATGLTSEQYTELKQKMLKSVYENGGFWIGRYEAGIEKNRTASGTPTIAPLSKAGTVDVPIYPYTYVTCKQAQTLASKLTTENYTSSLMFGVQWDLVLKYIEVKEVAKGTTETTIKSALRSNSKDWGNYYDATFKIDRGKYAKNGALTTWYNYNNENGLADCVTYVNGVSTKVSASSSSNAILLTTGASDACQKMNIYDLAGNVWEYTLEYTDFASSPCAVRGSNYLLTFYTASGRLSCNAATNGYDVGFRASIFK